MPLFATLYNALQYCWYWSVGICFCPDFGLLEEVVEIVVEIVDKVLFSSHHPHCAADIGRDAGFCLRKSSSCHSKVEICCIEREEGVMVAMMRVGSLDMAWLLTFVADSFGRGLGGTIARQVSHFAAYGAHQPRLCKADYQTHSCNASGLGCSRETYGRSRRKSSRSSLLLHTCSRSIFERAPSHPGDCVAPPEAQPRDDDWTFPKSWECSRTEL